MSNYTNFNTRIQSKIDTLSGWEAVKDSFIPLNGEICIAVIETADSVEGKTLPPIMIKVGNGQINADGNVEGSTWDQLDWVSAKAADVYGWAKQSTNDFVNTFLNLTMSDGTTMQSKLDGVFATDAELAKAIADLRAEIPTQLGVMSVKVIDDDIVVGTPETATTGDVTIGLKHKKYEKAGTTSDVNGDAITAGASVTIKVPTLKIDEYGHTEFNGETSHTITIPNEVAVGDGNITISAGDGLAEGGIFNVNQDSDATITLKHADTSSVASVTKADRTYVSGLTFDDFGHVTAVEVGTESVENTAHTHSDGIGVKLTGNGGVEGDVKIDLDIKFNETLVAKENGTKYLQILDKTDNSVIAEFAATEFIKDGVLKNVELKTGDDEHSVENGPYLVFTWNLDNVLGEDNDENADILWVPVKDLIDTYTADGTSLELLDNNIFAIKTNGVTTDKIANSAVTTDKIDNSAVIEGKLADDAVTTNKIKNENVTKAKLSPEVQASLGKADSALQAQDISGKADKVSGATAGNFAGLDANGNLTDSGMNAANFEGAGTAQGLIDALDSQIKSSDEDNNKVSVLTGITQENGKLTAKTEVKLAAVAKTGVINDLSQTQDTVIIFNCGSSTSVI